MGRYTGWITIFAIAGTLAAMAAIAIAEAFVPATLLVLTTGEWELLAGVFYVIAVLLYLAEGGRLGNSRGSRGAVSLSLVRLHRKYNFRGRPAYAPRQDQDADYVNTLELAEA